MSRLLGTALHSSRVNGRDSRVPHKVPRVEGEQLRDLVDDHGRDQARIVHLCARNRVGN
jgi:hypothetical protein